ncbi:cytochrome P450 [Suillus weaverae]|nr:cytochrome P450 [Suillus weaverae]
MFKRFQMLIRPVAFLIERYQILKYVPGYTTKLEGWRREGSQVFHDQLNRVSRELATGKAGSSFARYRLKNQSSHKLSDEEIAASPFGVGSDTTAVAIMYVVMASACYPKAQEKVQEQLDIVGDRERSPMFDNYNSLPQIEAFMLECLRWRPMTTLGFVHCIGRGRLWQSHATRMFTPTLTAYKSDPERWLNSEGKIRDDLKFPPYGFGRRYGLA